MSQSSQFIGYLVCLSETMPRDDAMVNHHDPQLLKLFEFNKNNWWSDPFDNDDGYLIECVIEKLAITKNQISKMRFNLVDDVE